MLLLLTLVRARYSCDVGSGDVLCYLPVLVARAHVGMCQWDPCVWLRRFCSRTLLLGAMRRTLTAWQSKHFHVVVCCLFAALAPTTLISASFRPTQALALFPSTAEVVGLSVATSALGMGTLEVDESGLQVWVYVC